MNFKSLSIIVITSLALSACAGKPKSGNLNASNEDGKICTFEKSTGSHIGKKICRTKAQIEHQKKVAQDAIREMQKGKTATL